MQQRSIAERFKENQQNNTGPVGGADTVQSREDDHRDVAQLGSALRLGRRGRRFESCHRDN